MWQLVQHILAMSAVRDRTRLNAGLVSALADIAQTECTRLYCHLPVAAVPLALPCAEKGPQGFSVHDAYRPSLGRALPVASLPALDRCLGQAAPVCEVLDGGAERLLMPVLARDRVGHVVELIGPPLTPETRSMVDALLDYHSNHLALIEYSETDMLTGLFNRKTFDERLFQVLGEAAGDEGAQSLPLPRRRVGRPGRSHWLAEVDVDRFKSINDKHGHLIGDEVLVLLARLMRESFRLDDQLFRFGGEEFIAVLQPASRVDALRVLERMRLRVERADFPQVGRVTVSIGLTRIEVADTAADVLGRADEALYYAKGHGRNQVWSFEDLIEAGHLARKAPHKADIELF